MLSSNPTIWLLGSSCRAAAQSAKRAGVSNILAWDDFIDADLVDVANASPLADFLIEQTNPIPKSQGVPLVLCGGMENRPDFLSRLLSQGLLCGVTNESLRQLRSLEAWKDWTYESGIGWPETIGPLRTGTLSIGTLSIGTLRSSSVKDSGAWMLKPTGGAGGIHVRSYASLDAIDQTRALDPAIGPWYAQRHIAGTTIGVTYCSDRKETCIAGIARGIDARDLDAPLPFIYRGNLAPFRVTPDRFDAASRFGEIVARATGIRGLWQADFQIDSQDRLWLLEINPRWSASMELHETLQGVSWMKEHLRILIGQGSDQPLPKVPEGIVMDDKGTHKQMAKGIVYAPRDIRASSSQVDRLWQARWHGSLEELEKHEFRVADIPQRVPAGVCFDKGIPIATVLCVGDSTEWLISKIQHARKKVLDWLEKV